MTRAFHPSPLLLLLCVGFSFGRSVTYDVVSEWIQPDGFNRTGAVVDGSVPGPLITANKGERITVTFNNKLHNTTMQRSTSVHWHGLYQRNSTYEDGTAFVSQCPIAPTTSYTYDFSTGQQAGTFWYHSHLSEQYCDGLRGPLVIYDPHDPLQYLYDVDDASTVIDFADWNHLPSPEVFVIGELPPSSLVNGRGRYKGGPEVPLSNITVEQGKRYRLRFLNTGCLSYFNVTIDGHQLQIIEIDGQEVQPYTVDGFQMHPGQRFSGILTANQPVSNYWIRGAVNVGSPASATLRYKGAPDEYPTSNASDGTILLTEANLKPLNPSPLIGRKTDIALNLVINQTNPPIGNFTVNGYRYNPPDVPVLLQILSGKSTAQDLMPQGDVYTLPPNKVIEISMPGQGIIPHPMHLHGHSFDVVRSVGSAQYNYDNPPRRDVVNIGTTADNVTIRFLTDNNGPWMLHCHVDVHLEGGLAVIFAEDTQSIKSTQHPPKSWDQLCPAYNRINQG